MKVTTLLKRLLGRDEARRAQLLAELREIARQLDAAQRDHGALALRNTVHESAREMGLLLDHLEYET